jgi:hypothetical protein
VSSQKYIWVCYFTYLSWKARNSEKLKKDQELVDKAGICLKFTNGSWGRATIENWQLYDTIA